MMGDGGIDDPPSDLVWFGLGYLGGDCSFSLVGALSDLHVRIARTAVEPINRWFIAALPVRVARAATCSSTLSTATLLEYYWRRK